MIDLLLFWTVDAHQCWEIGLADTVMHAAGVWAYIQNIRRECFEHASYCMPYVFFFKGYTFIARYILKVMP